MTDERKQLPAVSVPPEGYALIRSFARTADVSVSEAMRQLLRESPRLIEFAKQTDVNLDVLGVSVWGGSRGEKK